MESMRAQGYFNNNSYQQPQEIGIEFLEQNM